MFLSQFDTKANEKSINLNVKITNAINFVSHLGYGANNVIAFKYFFNVDGMTVITIDE